MTGPDDSQAVTRPISVAELLAKNGTIGSTRVTGGHRRRRRGNSDAVTVAELTGEIPIIRVDDSGAIPVVVDDIEDAAPEPESELDLELDAAPESESELDLATEPEPEPDPEPEPEPEVDGSAVATEHNGAARTDSPATDSVRAPEAGGLERAPEPMPRRGRDAPPQRSAYPRPVRPLEEPAPAAASDAEAMSPDPIEDLDDEPIVAATDTAEPTDDVVADELGLGDASSAAVGEALLFGGDSMADELARGGTATVEPIAGDLSDELLDDPDTAEQLDDADLHDAFGEDYDEYEEYAEPTRGQLIVRGLLVALQSILAVAFGAGLFLAFDRLWLWNSLVAMVLAILATLGLVAGVWVVRKTEDIASTLIAVGVGLLVTFGPLALMHAT